MDQCFVKTAVIKDHHLMDHRQFEMCFRIINREPAVFDHGDLNKQVKPIMLYIIT